MVIVNKSTPPTGAYPSSLVEWLYWKGVTGAWMPALYMLTIKQYNTKIWNSTFILSTFFTMQMYDDLKKFNISSSDYVTTSRVCNHLKGNSYLKNWKTSVVPKLFSGGYKLLRNGYTYLRSGYKHLRNGYTYLRNGYKHLRNGCTYLRNEFTDLRSRWKLLRNGYLLLRQAGISLLTPRI